MSRGPDSLAPLLDRVDKVIVITVASAVARQEAMKELLDFHELPFEFFIGLDGRGMTAEDLAANGVYDPVARAQLGRAAMTPGEIGCAASHRDAAARLIQGTDRSVLIMEDDLSILPGGLARVKDTMRDMPMSWSLAYFAYASMNLETPLSARLKLASYYPLRYMLGSVRHNPHTIRRIYRRPLNASWMHAGWFNGALAYAIDRAAAEFILELQSRVWLESDVALGRLVRFSRLDAICAAHRVFDQREGVQSVIGARPSWESHP